MNAPLFVQTFLTGWNRLPSMKEEEGLHYCGRARVIMSRCLPKQHEGNGVLTSCQPHRFNRTGSTAQGQPHRVNRTGSTAQDQPHRVNRTGSTAQGQPHRIRIGSANIVKSQPTLGEEKIVNVYLNAVYYDKNDMRIFGVSPFFKLQNNT